MNCRFSVSFLPLSAWTSRPIGDNLFYLGLTWEEKADRLKASLPTPGICALANDKGKPILKQSKYHDVLFQREKGHEHEHFSSAYGRAIVKMGFSKPRIIILPILVLQGFLVTIRALSVPINETANLSNANSIEWPWSDLGINCRGSPWCTQGYHFWEQVPNNLASLKHILKEFPGVSRRVWSVNTHIACEFAFDRHSVWPLPGYWCLFAQGNVPWGVVDGPLVERKVQQLLDHGCRRCGSVPLRDDNNPADGILTMNYVVASDCIGVCKSLGDLGEYNKTSSMKNESFII